MRKTTLAIIALLSISSVAFSSKTEYKVVHTNNVTNNAGKTKIDLTIIAPTRPPKDELRKLLLDLYSEYHKDNVAEVWIRVYFSEN